MNIHEYQAKQLFGSYGLPVSQGIAAETAEQVAEAIDQIDDSRWVVKAQVHAGGRGKAGGVKLVENKQEAVDFANQCLAKIWLLFRPMKTDNQ